MFVVNNFKCSFFVGNTVFYRVSLIIIHYFVLLSCQLLTKLTIKQDCVTSLLFNIIINFILTFLNTVVGLYINTMKTTFLFKF